MSYLKNFHYVISGNPEARPLVFLHGLMGYAQNWRRISLAFESTHHILVFDQRGHGRSFHPESGYSPEHYAEDLYLILKELNWTDIDLVGHSMGGRNALHFTHKYPEMVHRLVIEDIGPNSDARAIDRIKKLIEMVPTPFKQKAEARHFFMQEFEQKAHAYPQAKSLGQYFYANLEVKADGTTDWRFSKKAIEMSLEEGRTVERWGEIENLYTPCLLVRGERSPDLPRDVFEEVLRRNSRIKGVEIEDSGHWVHFDQPERFISEVRNFLLENNS